MVYRSTGIDIIWRSNGTLKQLLLYPVQMIGPISDLTCPWGPGRPTQKLPVSAEHKFWYPYIQKFTRVLKCPPKYFMKFVTLFTDSLP